MQTVITSTLQDTSTGIFYPSSDGEPMANNTEHLKIIFATQKGLEAVFAEQEDVFIAADLFWYPVEGKPKTVVAPDVFVVFGRPKGERMSYKQWEEDGVAPQVVFEFQSTSNTSAEMNRKLLFFNTYGVQEYYLYDIERNKLEGYVRFQEDDDMLEEIPEMHDWKSPRMGIRFRCEADGLQLYKPNGSPFLGYDDYTNIEERWANAESRADEERQRANEERQRANALAAKLRELGINPDDM